MANTTNSTCAATSPPRGSLRRWSLLLSLGFVVGYLVSGFWPAKSAATPTNTFAGSETPTSDTPDQLPLTIPNPAMSPREVVTVQVKALAEYRTNRAAIHQVYAMASPGNQAAQGPLDRFEAMIGRAPFNEMFLGTRCTVGKAVVRGHQATVLVTIFDDQNRASIYRFFLSRQQGRWEGCWMTDAVYCQHSKQTPPQAEQPQASVRATQRRLPV